MAKGHTFESETDTEVLVKLIDSCYEGEPLKALRAALAMVRGSYALAVLFRDSRIPCSRSSGRARSSWAGAKRKTLLRRISRRC